MADTQPKTATMGANAGAARGIPGSGSSPHPSHAIPLPAHGFATLDALPDPGEVSPAEVITRAAVLLMSAAAGRLGLTPDSEPAIDLDGARPLITALAALLAGSGAALGERTDALVAGLRSLQLAFREASRYPDEPGTGPGEQYFG